MSGNIDLTLKILHLLGEGFHLKFERSRAGRRSVYEKCDRIWHTVDRKQLYQILDRLRLRGIIKVIREGDSVERITLTNRTRAYLLKRQFKILSIKCSGRWDRKWRIVLFDVPEQLRNKRDVLRSKLKSIGFLEFQKSTFVYPFPCKDEINFIINFLEIPEHVYYIEAPIAPDDILRKSFKL